MFRMKRRKFIALIAGAATGWPLTARTQQPATPVIGFLNSASAGPYRQLVDAFRRGLNETGFVEGRNVMIDYRWADGRTAPPPSGSRPSHFGPRQSRFR